MRQSLDELVPRYQKDLYRAAFAVCGSHQEAEDAMQDAFLKYAWSRKEFESEEHIRAWLLRVVINRSRDIARSFWHRNRESLESCAAFPAFESEEDGEVLRAVMSLPERYRAAIFLFYYEGYSVREIGRILRARESTVKSWLHRARMLLKDTLREAWNDDEPGQD